MKLPNTHIAFCNMLYDCIDLSDYDDKTLMQVIQVETGKTELTIESVESWLRGLPSACTIPFGNHDIEVILEFCGNGHWSIDEYWRFAANRVIAYATHPKAYA